MTVRSLHQSSPRELAERIAAERRGVPFLMLRDGAGEQRIVPLTEAGSPVTVGRQASSGIALAWDDQVSRAHAELERIGDVWTVVDDGRSRNGSFVNGERVHGRRVLRNGDVLVLGRTTMTFVAPLADTERSTAAGAERPTPALSAAQRRVLVALCRPFAASRFATPPSNRQLAAAGRRLRPRRPRVRPAGDRGAGPDLRARARHPDRGDRIIPGFDDVISKWFPSGAANAAAGTASGEDSLDQVPAGLLLAAYAAAFLVAGIMVMRRRDVSA